MIRRTGFGFLLSLVFIIFAYSSAVADTPVFKSNDGKWYGSVNAGITILNDIPFSVAVSGSGFTASAEGSYTFDAAPSIGGAVGYVINDFVRTEIELGYQNIEMDKFKFAGNLTVGSTVYTSTGEFDIKGDIDALHFLTNVILTPLGTKTLLGVPFTPLVGAGIGFISMETTIESITTAVVNSKVSNTDFLASIMTGLEYASSQQVTWAIKYRHSWVDSGEFGAEDAEIDSIGANVNMAF
jgi:opacity protein-like surface antigen